MAMNFFEHQDHARRRTGRLVVYFAMAVICIVLVLYALGDYHRMAHQVITFEAITRKLVKLVYAVGYR